MIDDDELWAAAGPASVVQVPRGLAEHLRLTGLGQMHALTRLRERVQAVNRAERLRFGLKARLETTVMLRAAGFPEASKEQEASTQDIHGLATSVYEQAFSQIQDVGAQIQSLAARRDALLSFFADFRDAAVEHGRGSVLRLLLRDGAFAAGLRNLSPFRRLRENVIVALCLPTSTLVHCFYDKVGVLELFVHLPDSHRGHDSLRRLAKRAEGIGIVGASALTLVDGLELSSPSSTPLGFALAGLGHGRARRREEVVAVDVNGWANASGVCRGDFLLSVAGSATSDISPRDLEKAIVSLRPLSLLFCTPSSAKSLDVIESDSLGPPPLVMAPSRLRPEYIDHLGRNWPRLPFDTSYGED